MLAQAHSKKNKGSRSLALSLIYDPGTQEAEAGELPRVRGQHSLRKVPRHTGGATLRDPVSNISSHRGALRGFGVRVGRLCSLKATVPELLLHVSEPQGSLQSLF